MKKAMPTFSFEHWKCTGGSNTPNKLAKKTSDPLVAFKAFMASRTRNKDMICVHSSNENYVDPMFGIIDLRGYDEERLGLPYGYYMFLEACDLTRYYAMIPMSADTAKIKKAPLKCEYQ